MSTNATFLPTADAIAKQIPDGCTLAVTRDISGVSMAVVRALVRRAARDLHVVCVPIGGLNVDILVGAGCVATVETSAVSLGEYGGAPRFNAAVKAGRIKLLDATCPAIHAAFQAAEKGLPFMPLRGILGSDLLAQRPDWQVIDNPFAAARDPIVLLPAIRPDVALFHTPKADTNGNVFIGINRELMMMAHAAKRTFVTVEEIVDDDLLADEGTAAGTIPSLYVSGIAEVRRGAWPHGLWDLYPADEAHLADYAARARTDQGFADYVREFVLSDARAAAE